MVTSEEKIKEILDWVQNTQCIDWHFMGCLKQDLELLALIAKKEGAEEMENILSKA